MTDRGVFQAYLFYRTSCTAVESLGLNLDALSREMRLAEAQEDYRYQRSLMEALTTESEELDVWEQRLQRSGLALVHDIAFYALGRTLPDEIAEEIAQYLLPRLNRSSIPF